MGRGPHSLRAAIALAVAFLASGYGAAAAFEWKAIEPFIIGGRFQYVTAFDRESDPFAWNTTAQSAEDVSRLMLDVTADTRYGDLYLKGAAVWDGTRPSQELKRFVLDQGDYLWVEKRFGMDYGLRLFANERRFITNDQIAPLLHDDRVGRDGTLGARFDSSVNRKFDTTLLYSALGRTDETMALREIAYLRAAYAGLPVIGSVSYALEHPRDAFTANHAMFKAELATTYKRAHAVASFQQTAYSGRSVFFPSGGSGSGAGLRESLPENSALFAELRVTSLPLGSAGNMKLMYSYTCVGDAYYNDLSLPTPVQESNEATAYFSAAAVDLRARVAYGAFKRSRFESDDVRRGRASVWGRFANDIDFSVRGEVSDSDVLPDGANFVGASLQKQLKKVRSGVHALWKDLDSIYSSTRYAWDGLLAASPNWGFYWRFLVSEQFDVGEMFYTRLSYRPNNRIFLTFSYGRTTIGDGPYLIEDQDIELSRFGTAQYTILLRGDF